MTNKNKNKSKTATMTPETAFGVVNMAEKLYMTGDLSPQESLERARAFYALIDATPEGRLAAEFDDDDDSDDDDDYDDDDSDD